jgi:5-formyltetrahydrofolate cyclo-ligase
MTKAELRKDVLKARREMVQEDRDLKDRLIFQRAHKDRAFQIARRVLIYRSTPYEVSTAPFIEYAWGIGKEVFVPRVEGGTLHHVRVTRSTTYVEGPNGIMEPVRTSMDVTITAETMDHDDVIVVPVVAFDAQCRRIGYYDRFLAAHRGHVLGLAYELQRVKAVPTEPHDVALRRIATEERWYDR